MRLTLSADVRGLNPDLAAQLQVTESAAKARVPRAPKDEAVGLNALLRRGWSIQSPDCTQYRLYQIWGPRLDTGLCADLATACDRARGLAHACYTEAEAPSVLMR